MQIAPAIVTLRSDPAAQHRAQAAVEGAKSQWLDQQPARQLADALARYGKGEPLERLEPLVRLVEEPGHAMALVASLAEPMLAAVAAEPLAHVPFRHSIRTGHCSLQLLAEGRASLSLNLYGALPDAGAPRSVSFPDSERHEIVLAGAAQARIVRRTARADGGAALDLEPFPLAPGTVLSLDGPSSARVIDRVEGRLVVLRFGRAPEHPGVADEYALETGGLVHRASGAKGQSQQALALELLGRMQRTDALAPIGRIVAEANDDVRWLALREAIALDAAAGYGMLTAVATDPLDTLAAPAGALRAQLRETYPQLEDDRCRA